MKEITITEKEFINLLLDLQIEREKYFNEEYDIALIENFFVLNIFLVKFLLIMDLDFFFLCIFVAYFFKIHVLFT